MAKTSRRIRASGRLSRAILENDFAGSFYRFKGFQLATHRTI
jgi:hypothetical protein